MSDSVTIKRYLLIINYLIDNKKPKLKNILENIQNIGLVISKRTLQRDIENLKEEFFINIKIDHTDNSYFIDYDDSDYIAEIRRFFEMSNSAQVMINTIKEGKNTLKYLSLDSSENLTGIELLEPLIKAVKMKQVITFNHFSFQTEQTKSITLHPYLLKEYKNRWFLFGENCKHNDFGIYGIERISNLVPTGNYFVPKADYDPKTNFKNVIGIATRPFAEGLPEQDFILSMTQEQGRYFKTLPWHPNYKPLIDDENEFKVSLHLLPNYEFMQILYQYCDKVTVLEPQWLRDHLKEKFKASSDKY